VELQRVLWLVLVKFWADFGFLSDFGQILVSVRFRADFGFLVQCLGMGIDVWPVFGQFWFLLVFFDCWT